MEARVERLTDAYLVGIELRNRIRRGCSLSEVLQALDGPFDRLEDSYPEWHPAPFSFYGMVKLFLYREITGESYRTLTQQSELAAMCGLDRLPSESVLSRTWRNRFDEGVCEFITTAAHYLVKEIHDKGLSVPNARPKEEVLHPRRDPESCTTEESEATGEEEFTAETIRQTTRLARDYGFDSFDSERAENATYEDSRFFELQTFMGMVGCGTAQGAARFQYRQGAEYGPHGDTHLRAVKQFDPENLIEGFDSATDRVLSAIATETAFHRPVTVAIDIMTVPYYGDVGACRWSVECLVRRNGRSSLRCSR